MKNIYKEIVENCYSLDLNMNDVFWWGSAMSCEIDTEDIDVMMPLFKKHDVTSALMAYAAVKHGFNDVMEERRDPEIREQHDVKYPVLTDFDESMKWIKERKKEKKYFCLTEEEEGNL